VNNLFVDLKNYRKSNQDFYLDKCFFSSFPQVLTRCYRNVALYLQAFALTSELTFNFSSFRATTTLIVSIVLTTIGRNSAQLPTGAVVTNGHNCGKIGAAILDLDGSAVDAAIASLFCEGVSVPQALGLGGGFIMTIYMKETGTAVTLNSREVAPAAASQDMFHGDETLAVSGGLAVAVPAELKGYWEAYNKYGGKVPWKDLVQPTIDLCNNGILVTEIWRRCWPA
jgi:gamma-glutamyltranspeptidase